MNDALDTTLVLELGEKPSVQYRTSSYTVRQYCALPYAQRRAVDAACDAQAGLHYRMETDPKTEKTFTVGRRTTEPTPHLSIPLPTMFLSECAPAALLDQATPDVEEPTAPAQPTSGPAFFATLAQATAAATTPAPPAAPVALDGTIYSTTDYDLFHLLPENRVVDPRHVRKLVAMIAQSNLLHLKPLDVTAELGVIDGQHRLAAARELGLPVYYKIEQQLSEADITTLNVAQKNWQGTDYLHYWTVKGRPDYVALTAFMQRHPMLSFSNAKMMLGENQKGAAEEFRKGQWKAGEAYEAEQVAELVERIAAEVPTFKQPTHTGFVSALHHCVTSLDGFDAKEFTRTVLAQPRALVPCAGHKQWLAMFQEIYNYRKNEGNRLRFL